MKALEKGIQVRALDQLVAFTMLATLAVAQEARRPAASQPSPSPRLRVGIQGSRFARLEAGVRDYLVTADGATREPVERNRLFDGAVSGDGKLLARSRWRQKNRDIWVSFPDGSGERRLTHHEAMDAMPAWSPDRKRVVFCSKRSGPWQLFVADYKSGKVTALPDYDGDATDPQFVPSGDAVCFIGRPRDRKRRGKAPRLGDLVRLDLASEQSRVVVSKVDLWEFAISPDGRYAAISNASLDIVELKTGKPVRRIEYTSIDKKLFAHAARFLCWRPDSAAVACKIGFLGGREGGTVVFGDHHVFVIPVQRGEPSVLDFTEECGGKSDRGPRPLAWQRVPRPSRR